MQHLNKVRNQIIFIVLKEENERNLSLKFKIKPTKFSKTWWFLQNKQL